MPTGRRVAIRSCLMALGLSGCTGFGPETMRYQQADYASALADAGKRQTLLNIVKLRYGDVPAFVTVNQILAGYSLQGTISVGTELLTGGSFRLSDDANVGVGGTFTNSPTITYAPVTGAAFARTFLAPLQPADLFGLMLSSVPPELVLGLGLHSLGPYDNERATPGRSGRRPGLHRGAGPAARPAAHRPTAGPAGGPGAAPHRHLRSARATRPDRPNDGCRACWRCRRSPNVRGRLLAGPTRAGADPDPHPLADRGDWASSPRTSTVPKGDVPEGRTERATERPARRDAAAACTRAARVFEPRDAFVAVAYDGDWFWIANDDLAPSACSPSSCCCCR